MSRELVNWVASRDRHLQDQDRPFMLVKYRGREGGRSGGQSVMQQLDILSYSMTSRWVV
jgi:hypothetical protein